MKKGAKLVMLVSDVTDPKPADRDFYRYSWFVRLGCADGEKSRFVAVNYNDPVPRVGELVILKYWHTDRDADQIWRILKR